MWEVYLVGNEVTPAAMVTLARVAHERAEMEAGPIRKITVEANEGEAAALGRLLDATFPQPGEDDGGTPWAAHARPKVDTVWPWRKSDKTEDDLVNEYANAIPEDWKSVKERLCIAPMADWLGRPVPTGARPDGGSVEGSNGLCCCDEK